MAIFNSYVSLPEGDMFLVATNSYPRLFLQGRTVHVLEVTSVTSVRWGSMGISLLVGGDWNMTG